MIIAVLLAILAVLILAVNLSVGYGTAAAGRWEDWSQRARSTTATTRPDKPVTKRYLIGTALLSAVYIAVIIPVCVHHDHSVSQIVFSAVYPFLLVGPGLFRLYKEYRKPGHGSRYARPEPSPDEDW